MGEPGVLRLPAWFAARHPRLFDAALGAIFAGGALVGATINPERFGSGPGGADFVVAALAFGLIALRRRWPLPVLAASTTVAVAFMAVGRERPVLVATTVVAAYTLASLSDRATAWLAGGAAALIVYAASVRWTGHGWLDSGSVGIFAWTGMATAVGDATRSRRAYVAAVEERARRAEQDRDEEARRQVVEERLRISRELHDVVAHHIAVINVQAGVAAHVLGEQPDQARRALNQVRHAARTVVEELATVVGVLRQSGEAQQPTEPARGLGRLAELLDSLAAAGLRVEYHQAGRARAVPAAIDLAAYRIIQEALTNAHKHGTGATASLQLAYTTDGLIIDVINPAPRPPRAPAGTGHGLVGMRERAIAVGGTLRAEPDTDGHFAVHAELASPVQSGEPV